MRTKLIQIHEWSLLLLAFAIPLYKPALPYIIVLSLLLAIPVFNWQIVQKNVSKLFLPFFYITLIISLAYSNNVAEGLSRLETQLSVLLFPLLFISAQSNHRRYLFFIFGTFISMLISLTFFGVQAFRNQWYMSNDFYILIIKNLSLFHHNSYFSLYIIFSLVLIVSFRLKKLNYIVTKPYFIAFFVVLALAFIMLLASRAAIISLLVVLFYVFVININKIKLKFKLIGFFSIALVLALSTLHPKIQNNLQLLFEPSTHHSPQETDKRLLIWNDAIELIKQDPLFGVGIGDAPALLKTIHKKWNIDKMEDYNAHNQFFEIWMAAGLLALLLFVVALFLPLRDALKNKDHVLVLFLALMFINFLVESVLFTLAGVSFFAFFYVNLWLIPYRIQPKQNKHSSLN